MEASEDDESNPDDADPDSRRGSVRLCGLWSLLLLLLLCVQLLIAGLRLLSSSKRVEVPTQPPLQFEHTNRLSSGRISK